MEAFNSFMAKKKTKVYWVVERKVTHLGLVNMKTIVISLIIDMKFSNNSFLVINDALLLKKCVFVVCMNHVCMKCTIVLYELTTKIQFVPYLFWLCDT
jgi:hypothetical protein